MWLTRDLVTAPELLYCILLISDGTFKPNPQTSPEMWRAFVQSQSIRDWIGFDRASSVDFWFPELFALWRWIYGDIHEHTPHKLHEAPFVLSDGFVSVWRFPVVHWGAFPGTLVLLRGASLWPRRKFTNWWEGLMARLCCSFFVVKVWYDCYGVYSIFMLFCFIAPCV